MRNLSLGSLILLLLPLSLWAQDTLRLSAPSENLQASFYLDTQGKPSYSLQYKEIPVLQPSSLGLALVDDEDLLAGFQLLNHTHTTEDSYWEPVWGEYARIRNRYQELLVELAQPNTGRKLNIRFRLFDEGLAFRYEFPKQEQLTYFILQEEHSQFHLAEDYKAFWLPGDYDTNEYPISSSLLSEIPQAMEAATIPIHAQSPIRSQLAVQTPLMLKGTTNGLYINLHEAALIDYPAMQLNLDAENFRLESHLVPDAIGNKGYLQTPAQSPWRTLIVADDARQILAANRMILNLNEPHVLEDVSWIKPMKYIGIWWEYFVAGKSTWAYSDTTNVKLSDDFSTFRPNGRHGATAENVRRHVDFAAEYGFDAVLVEGWNIGWEDWFGKWKEEVFDFVTPYPDFDVEALNAYAASKGVKLMMHHETSGAITNYERRLDRAFAFMEKHGYNSVKTGYVGKLIPRGEHHDGQLAVNHFIHVARRAADYKIMINSHEATRPTGLHRTYPNWLAQESARGTEFEAFGGLAPNHTTILPFTRLMGGPMDYTPGIFQTDLSYYGTGSQQLVQTTLAKQLAYYVTLYSPLQMAADLPENYLRFPDAFQFIRDVAVDWEDTYILEAEPGEYVSIGRKAKGQAAWFIGAITNENSRTTVLDLDFLPEGKTFEATLYGDAADASWDKNPQAYVIETRTVRRGDRLEHYLAPGGGLAIHIR
ncbi:Glycoside hydrolase family protein [Nitritalea halalkaliphila LW7]|uniref:Glycoside hydrolase family protein n=1 Tax=Nitritalea halalkaliphila LW7 TaxID=1189621 RepID=I5BZ47_9BACT|nr:glycoside hydrolase family 97 protein [Nitritalea halalkaliphila]EIM74849.1 Glycoside hydrolase family protein [Nitritalea halalkaliphila LW7]